MTFGAEGKTIMTVNFRPVKRRRLSHFNLNVPCQVKYELTVPKQLETTDQWEVALMDLSFPEKWEDVHSMEMSFTIGMDGKYLAGYCWTKYIEAGYYTPARLVDWIKTHGIHPHIKTRVQIFYGEDGKFTLGLRYSDHSHGFTDQVNACMKISAPLCYVLGFDDEVELDTTPNWTPPPNVIRTVETIPGEPQYNNQLYKFTPKEKKVDISGYRIFYVYAPDMCKDMRVGQYQTPLLQYLIPEDAEQRGRNKIKEFNALSYIGLKENLQTLREIVVEICDELGRLVVFTDADIQPTATLNFCVKETRVQ